MSEGRTSLNTMSSANPVLSNRTTDLIIPLHRYDDTAINQSYVLDLTIQFEDVLDPEHIYSSLERLMQMGDWKKLGARLRKNDNGRLEYHVPQHFTGERPAFAFTRARYNMKIGDHPLASKLPKATTAPSVLADPRSFQPLMRCPNTPTKIEDYLFSDRPQLALHMVSFDDATLLSLNWPHTFVDMMGLKSLIDAWTRVLSGREDQVPPLHGFDFDPLANLGRAQQTKASVLASLKLGILSSIFFGICYMFELFWWRRESRRIVCLPKRYVQKLKDKALQEIQGGHCDQKVFLSDGDVIAAWWTRLAIQHIISPTSTQTVTIMMPFDIRGLFEDLLPSTKAYIGNACFALYTCLPASDFFQSFGSSALQIRRNIKLQGTRDQMQASSKADQEARDATGIPALYGDSSMRLVVITNWTKAKLFELDFRAAVVSQDQVKHSSEKISGTGRPVGIFTRGWSNALAGRYAFSIFGKDVEGNYFLSGCLRDEAWKGIEESLKKDWQESDQPS